MTITNLDQKLKNLKSFSSLEKASFIKQIVTEFQGLENTSSEDKEELVKRLKKVIYTIRMELAFNKATESNSTKCCSIREAPRLDR